MKDKMKDEGVDISKIPEHPLVGIQRSGGPCMICWDLDLLLLSRYEGTLAGVPTSCQPHMSSHRLNHAHNRDSYITSQLSISAGYWRGHGV